MKRVMTVLAVLLLTGATVWALYGTGSGQVVTASTTPSRITDFTANTVSIYNGSAPVVHAMVNCTTGTLAAAATAGTAVPIPQGVTYTFDANGKDQITSVSVMTTNSTATAYIGYF